MIKCEIHSDMAEITVDGKRCDLCAELVIIVAKLIEKGALYNVDKRCLVKLLTDSPEFAKYTLDILRAN